MIMENEGIGAAAVPMLDDMVAATRTPLYILLAAVGALLLIGCANLANLLFAGALVRQREFAVRAALGAGRRRLILQSVGEPAPVSFAAATAVLFVVTLAACAVPARRAAGVDPSVALRVE